MSVKYETPGLGASAVLMALRLPTGLAHTIGELRYEGRVSGRRTALPVSFVRAGDSVVVRVANSATKTWWRNFRKPHPASIRIDGEWFSGIGHVVRPASLEHEQVEALFLQARPRTQASAIDPYVVFEVGSRAESDVLPSLRRRWFTRVTLGEFLGFAAPALGGALVADGRPAVVAGTMLFAGAVEGAVLGAFQAGVLRTVLSRLRIRDWVAATAAGGIVAWSVGVLLMLFGEKLGEWPIGAQIPVIAAGALIMVFALGIAQWIVLRRFTDRAVLWIWGTAVAWVAGLISFTLVTSPLWQPGQAVPLVAAIGALGGLVMAAVMAAVTGAFLTRVLAAGHATRPR
ncbi:hypothetical protein [Nocardia sp. NPDC127526]|uniref:hypothetical protein n=1 Tax=Nocardia sp. NPDC127526 TaxID=3345393 RepID=UPI00363C6C9D